MELSPAGSQLLILMSVNKEVIWRDFDLNWRQGEGLKLRLMDKEKQVFYCLSWGDRTRCKSRPPACLKVTFTRLMLALNPKHVPLTVQLHIHRSHTHGSHQLRMKNGLKRKIASILSIFSALPPEYHMVTFPQRLHCVKCSKPFLGV